MLDSDDLHPLHDRNDQSIDQRIRNLKCHRHCRGNPIFEGYIRSVPGGFQLEEKGRLFVEGLD